MKISGRIIVEVLDRGGGLVVFRKETHNFITELGDAHFAALAAGETPDPIGWIAVGSGRGQAATSTALATETARVALTGGYPDRQSGDDDNEVLYVATFGAGVATGVVQEAALFDAASGGIMIDYSDTFGVYNKGALQPMDFIFALRFGES